MCLGQSKALVGSFPQKGGNGGHVLKVTIQHDEIKVKMTVASNHAFRGLSTFRRVVVGPNSAAGNP